MKILHTLTFDLLTNGVPPVVDAVQADSNMRVIQATFWQGSEAVILDAGTAVSLACVKPDKTQCWYDTLPDGTKAATADGNSVSVTLAPEVMSCAGDVTACIVIHDSGGQISTFPFKIRVSRNPAAGNAISNSYYKVSTLEQINAVLDEMTTEIKAVNALIASIVAAGGAVRYDEEQDLTEEQQAQARQNIGAAAVGEGGGGSIDGDFPSFEKIEGVVEYNEIAKAVEVSTVEDLKSYEGNAILKGYKHASAADAISEDAEYCILKVPVQPGDVIRDKLASWWRTSNYASAMVYAMCYTQKGAGLSHDTAIIYFDGSTTGTSNYIDFRENGVIVPDLAAYALINIYARYYYNDASTSIKATNGWTAGVITVNADASLTAYDGLSLVPDYVGVGDGNSETYYQAVDDVRIPRYEDALGDIEAILADVVGGVE